MQTPPLGVKAVQISNSEMDKYGLKTGPSRKDTLPFKLFQKADMIADMQRSLINSSWGVCKKEVEEYPGTELLVVADVEEVYGENWWIALVEEVKEKYLFVSGQQQPPLAPAKQRWHGRGT